MGMDEIDHARLNEQLWNRTDEGAESEDELIGTEDGCDEDEDGGFTPTHESPSYRQSMTDAGRGHLLP